MSRAHYLIPHILSEVLALGHSHNNNDEIPHYTHLWLICAKRFKRKVAIKENQYVVKNGYLKLKAEVSLEQNQEGITRPDAVQNVF